MQPWTVQQWRSSCPQQNLALTRRLTCRNTPTSRPCACSRGWQLERVKRRPSHPWPRRGRIASRASSNEEPETRKQDAQDASIKNTIAGLEALLGVEPEPPKAGEVPSRRFYAALTLYCSSSQGINTPCTGEQWSTEGCTEGHCCDLLRPGTPGNCRGGCSQGSRPGREQRGKQGTEYHRADGAHVQGTSGSFCRRDWELTQQGGRAGTDARGSSQVVAD